MRRKAVSSSLLVLLAIGALALAVKIQRVNADGTIHINADGSIIPSTTPISTLDSVTYTLTGNVNDSIIVQRSNVVIDGHGHTVQGPGSGFGDGIFLSSVNNVTIRNTDVTDFVIGIYLTSSNNTVSNNDLTGNDEGIGLEVSYNTVSRNSIAGNNIGISSNSSSNNTVSDNKISMNHVGIVLAYCKSNAIFHNNFMNNTQQVTLYGSTPNSWDNGYPSGGNYWTDYAGADLFSGPHRNDSGSDGIGDTPEPIDANNTDYYPLMKPWAPYDGGAIYILDDGSIDPSGAPILRRGDLYALTGNVTSNPATLPMYNDGIVIERDNVTLDGTGYTIRGSGVGNGVDISSRNNVTTRNAYIEGFENGIMVWFSSNGKLSRNTAIGNSLGIHLESSSNTTLSGNNATRNRNGIFLDGSSDNILSQNLMDNNTCNLAVLGGQTSFYLDSIDTSNLINGKPVYYYINQENLAINPATHPNIGYLGLVDCNNMTVENLTLTNNQQGLLLANTTDSTITQNSLANNVEGIDLVDSDNNTVSGNTATENSLSGILLYFSSSNTVSGNNVTTSPALILSGAFSIWVQLSSNNSIHHNNLANAAVSSNSGPNSWDGGYPLAGNHWSYYNNSTDLHSGVYQNETGSDGIYDTPYVIDANNTDHYPLAAPTTAFAAGTWNGTPYNIEIMSNSTLSNMQINITNKKVSFNVTGPESSQGFCRMTVPNTIVQNLWHGNYTVLINDEPCKFKNWTDTTNTYIYINYTHSEHEVTIIPEIPLHITSMTLIILSTLALALTNKRKPRKPETHDLSSRFTSQYAHAQTRDRCPLCNGLKHSLHPCRLKS